MHLMLGLWVVSRWHLIFSSHASIRPSSPSPVHATIFARLEERRKDRALQQERDRLEALKHAQEKFDDFERQISLLQRPTIALTGECRREGRDEEGGGQAKDILFSGFPEPVRDARIQRDRCVCVCVCVCVPASTLRMCTCHLHTHWRHTHAHTPCSHNGHTHTHTHPADTHHPHTCTPTHPHTHKHTQLDTRTPTHTFRKMPTKKA